MKESDPEPATESEQHDDEFMFALSEVLVPRSWDGGYAALAEHEKVFVAVWELESTVQEGGFTQYFIDSSGDHSADAVEALRAIGAPRMAKILERARRVFPSGAPAADREARDTLLLREADVLEPRLAKLDAEYLEYPDDVTDLLSGYVTFLRAEFEASLESASGE
ncbi:MAG: DMP19 family protein [Planctomycetota bacterium]